MPTYLDYLIKTSISLAVIYLFYRLLLRQMTYYSCNRFYLLGFSLFSFLVPAIDVGAILQAEQLNNLRYILPRPGVAGRNSGTALTGTGWHPGIWQMVTAVYIGISAVLLLRLGVQLLSVAKIRSRAAVRMVGGIPVRHLPEPVVPFSFGNSMYINLDHYTAAEQQEIISHELVHVRQRHTVDLLVTEIICILTWFNPFAWLIRSDVRENLEFIADDAVVSKSHDRKGYQYLLLKVTGNIPCAVASNFSITSLKNRIVMMNKARTSKLHLLRFALLAPVIAVVVFAFRDNDGTPGRLVATSAQPETFFLSTLTYSIPDTRVKAIVSGASDKSLLKPGQLLNLSLVYHEKNRLKELLEKNGYRDLDNHSIRFLIDTASVRNSFTVEVHINVASSVVSTANKNHLQAAAAFSRETGIPRVYCINGNAATIRAIYNMEG